MKNGIVHFRLDSRLRGSDIMLIDGAALDDDGVCVGRTPERSAKDFVRGTGRGGLVCPRSSAMLRGRPGGLPPTEHASVLNPHRRVRD